MSENEQLEHLINQTLDGALATIPAHLQEIEQNKDIIQVENPNEFVYFYWKFFISSSNGKIRKHICAKSQVY